MINKIIITINNLEDIDKLKKLGITKYAFPLKGFCVGISNTFLITDIKVDGYLYINRILDNEGIAKLKEILNNLNSNIKGIIFDDLGVLELVKDLKIEKILYLSHFNANSKSIELYLNYVDSVFVCNDITKEEIEYIVKKIPNKLTLFLLGYDGAMYSRRLLLDNYSKFYNIEKKNPLLITNDNTQFLIYENEYGTYYYHYPLFNGILELQDLDVKYFFINSAFLDIEDIIDLLNGKSNIPYSKEFLYQKTICKVKGDKNA